MEYTKAQIETLLMNSPSDDFKLKVDLSEPVMLYFNIVAGTRSLLVMTRDQVGFSIDLKKGFLGKKVSFSHNNIYHRETHKDVPTFEELNAPERIQNLFMEVLQAETLIKLTEGCTQKGFGVEEEVSGRNNIMYSPNEWEVYYWQLPEDLDSVEVDKVCEPLGLCRQTFPAGFESTNDKFESFFSKSLFDVFGFSPTKSTLTKSSSF